MQDCTIIIDMNQSRHVQWTINVIDLGKWHHGITGFAGEQWGDSGYFQSPNYPNSYPANYDGVYVAHLSSPGVQTVRLWKEKCKSRMLTSEDV